jgi:hypothetical protein
MKKYVMNFIFEVAVEARNPMDAEDAARALVDDLQQRYHATKKHPSVVEAGFTFNDDMEEL